jgi:hypothetical protein
VILHPIATSDTHPVLLQLNISSTRTHRLSLNPEPAQRLRSSSFTTYSLYHCLHATGDSSKLLSRTQASYPGAQHGTPSMLPRMRTMRNPCANTETNAPPRMRKTPAQAPNPSPPPPKPPSPSPPLRPPPISPPPSSGTKMSSSPTSTAGRPTAQHA